MNKLEIFKYEKTEVRVVMVDGEPWWIAKDVCSVLGLSDVSMAIQNLDDDEKGTSKVGTLGGDQTMSIINKPGLYSLIIRSNKLEAKQFKHWITHEVLPSIRKIGSYGQVALPSYQNALRRLVDSLDKQEQLQIQAVKDKPKVEFYNDVTGSDDCISMAEVAKTLHLPFKRNKLFQFLREQKILQFNNQPYQIFVDKGYFRLIEQRYTIPCGDTRISLKTIVFQEGLEFINNLVKDYFKIL